MKLTALLLAALFFTASRADAQQGPPDLDIIDCHTHFYDPTRPEGVPFPGKGTPLYRTTLPEHLRAQKMFRRVTGTVIVEASPWVEDNAWLLKLAEKDPFVVGIVGNLQPGSPTFAKDLERFAANPLFRGIRLSGAAVEKLLAADALEELQLLADRDLVLDVNGGTGAVARLAGRLPSLRIVVNHTGHAPVSAAGPTEEWISAIRAAAKHPNVFCKISHLVRSALHEARQPGTTELDFYRPYLDVVWEAFGEDRVIYASNWPVSESISDYDALERIPLRHAFEKGEAATRKFCSLNSQRAYRWAERPGRRLPLGGVAQAQNNDAVTAGEFIIEPATIHNLGFEWKISGDDNRNATVAVQYRRQGESQWREAMPLLRIGDEKVWRVREFLEYRTPRMFAGSILDLDEATAYECRFTMSDPDGVSGTATQQVTVTTRSTPKIYTKGRTLHVYPPDYEGPKQEPSFKGLKEAYYGPGPGDWDVVHTRPVQPGDVILVHAGLYKADRMNYVTPYGVPFDGTYILTRDGTPEKPIVIKDAGDGEVIFDGDGCFRLFDVMGADYNYFEGITIRNTDVAFYSGHKDLLGNSGLVVRNCRIEDVGVAVMNEYAGSKKFYIADNVILGRDDRNRIIGWQHFGKYKPTQLKSYYAIKVYGQGHVICHNYIAYFHDGVCISSQPHKVYEPGDMDFSLKPNSKAVDAGCRLPNVNDDFTGKAPDLDALEVGKPQTIYGPRQ